MNSDNYYLYKNGQRQGPYTYNQLQNMWNQGIITSNDLYWKEGMADWQSLTLFPPLNSHQTPPPPSNQSTSTPQKSPKNIIRSIIFIALAVGTILFLFSIIATPSFLRARKRSQASVILNHLRLIDSAKDQYAIETNKHWSVTPNAADLAPYFKPGSHLHDAARANVLTDIFGNPYYIEDLATPPIISQETFDSLSDVAPPEFWHPYLQSN